MRKYVAPICAAIIAFLILRTAPAAAEDWPSHPVRIVNTFAPGGAADILARMAADQLTKAFGQQFYVETRAGAGGVIGVDFVAHSDPDGYNFVITTLSLTAINPLINAKIGYDPFKDLTHVAYLAGSPIVFIVSAKSDIKTLKDFVAKAKASPKPLTYGVSGLASAGQMIAESFAQLADLKFQVVPYKGAAQSQLDVVAGNIDFATPTVTSASPQLQGGTVIGLAQTAASGCRIIPTCRPSRSSATSSMRPTGSDLPVRPGFPPTSSARSTPRSMPAWRSPTTRAASARKA
jgi:tripartite-type tricarboxylate transporter receptor subunit TctC